MDSGRVSSTGRPTLPASHTSYPQAFSICVVSRVTVVLPFEPVIPMVGVLLRRANNSTSPITSTPQAFACFTCSMLSGKPGLSTNVSTPAKKSRGNVPVVTQIFNGADTLKVSRVSKALTFAPCCFRKRTQA